MSNDSATASAAGVSWSSLESFARDQVQTFVQRILEEEVSELLGRARSARRARVDAPADPQATAPPQPSQVPAR